jgi:precorrin-3B synthase
MSLHEAADGNLARIRIPGGRLTGAQWNVIVLASADLGDGGLELTSRGNVQIRGLKPDAGAELSQQLWSAGLLPSISHERVRNIIASPLSGLDGAGYLDVTPLVRELDAALCAVPRLAELSGRFLFAIDDGRGDVSTMDPDLGLIAIGADTFTLVVGGIVSVISLTRSDAVPAVIAAAEAFLDERAAQNSKAWRIAELHPPTSGKKCAPDDHNLPLVGRLAEGTVIAGAPLGRLTQQQARTLATDTVIVTPWRSVVLPHQPDELLAALAAVHLIVDASSPMHGVTSCAGLPGCAKSLADVRADALVVHAAAGAAALPVHWAGCERRCGRPTGQVVEVLATGAGYLVSGDPSGEWTATIERIL